MIKEVIGLVFIGIGIIWSLLEKTLCKSLCSVCTNQELSPCFFLFLFVGIILIVDGVSLVILGKESAKKKTDNKIIKKKIIKKKKK